MSLAGRGNLVQGAARQAAAKCGVKVGDAEGEAPRFAIEGGGFLQGPEALAQVLEHQ